MVKYTCKSYSRDGGKGRGREWKEGEERARSEWQGEQEGGGQREKQGLSQVVRSAKQVLHKHTGSKSQSTVTIARLNQIRLANLL